MTEFIKETITTQGTSLNPVASNSNQNVMSNSRSIEYLVYFLFGALDVLLTFRLVFKLMGASPVSSFVNLIYGLSGIFILPFEGIFRRGFAQGVETTSVLEPSTVVAIIVYGVLAWGIVKLIQVFSGEKQAT